MLRTEPMHDATKSSTERFKDFPAQRGFEHGAFAFVRKLSVLGFQIQI